MKKISEALLLLSLAIALATAAESCANSAQSTARASKRNVPVSISGSSGAARGARLLSEAISSIDILATDASTGSVVGTGPLHNSSGQWSGSLDVSDEGLVVFTAKATNTGNNLIDVGATSQVIDQNGIVVTIPIQNASLKAGAIQGSALQLGSSISSLAGDGAYQSPHDGTGGEAEFYGPTGLTTDGTTLFAADGTAGIRKINIATGEVTTLGAGLDNDFFGITTDGANLYVTDAANGIIYKMNIADLSLTQLGSSTFTFEQNGDYAAGGLTIWGGNLYVTDYDGAGGAPEIDQVSIADGTVTSLVTDFATDDTLRGITTNGEDLYFLTQDGLESAPIGGGNRTLVSEGLAGMVSLTTDGSYIYAGGYDISDSNGEVVKVPIGGGPVTSLVSIGSLGCYGIVTDGVNLFIGDFSNDYLYVINPGSGSIANNLPKGGGSTAALAASLGKGSAHRTRHTIGVLRGPKP